MDIYESLYSNKLFTAPGETIMEAANRFSLFDKDEIKARNKTLPLNKPTAQPTEIKIKGPVEIVPDEVARVCKALNNLNYQVFRNEENKNYHLNIVGIRNNSPEPNRFDDEIWVFWCNDNIWTLKKYKATTDPGLSYLEDPVSESGTAILKENQYIGAYRLGKHKGQYEALVQAKPITVIRDFNRDKKLDFSSGREQTGFFGVNIHRSSPSGESQFVNKWSAGCQVFANIHDFNEFIGICKKSIGEWGNEFSYSLINKNLL
jgi:hypothetical protein